MTIHAYIDESGTPDINDKRYYVITAAICRDTSLPAIRDGIKKISQQRLNGGEIRSKKVGKKSNTRKTILTDLSELPLEYIVCVNDKSLIKKDSGLKWKTSMYKFCQRMMFDRLYRNKRSIYVTADTFGRTDFMSSFERYLEKNFKISDLFVNKKFEYKTPIEEPLLQAADFIGGSIRRFYEGKDGQEVIQCIESKITGTKLWPKRFRTHKTAESDVVLDNQIAEHCFERAEAFIKSNADNLLREVCSIMLYDPVFVEGDFVYSQVLLKLMEQQGVINESKEPAWLRSDVIAPLRDAGVIIAACSEGYKIPDCREDIAKFMHFVERKEFPYLNRLVKMRESLKIGTGLNYDLAEDSVELKEIIKKLSSMMPA